MRPAPAHRVAVSLIAAATALSVGNPPAAAAVPSPVTTTTAAAAATDAGAGRAATTATAVAPSAIPRGLLGRDLERVPTRARVVALTFDAGGNAAGVTAILRTLEREKVAATFFLTGRWVRTYPRLARQIAARFPVANHSDTHPDMTRLSPAAQGRQIRAAATAIAVATGRPPTPLFRFPFGAVTPATIRTANANGYACIRWTVDTLGWMGTSGGQSTASVTRRVLRGATPGEIVLMHVGSHPRDRSTLDAAALPAVIGGLRAKGYRFVSLPGVLGL